MIIVRPKCLENAGFFRFGEAKLVPYLCTMAGNRLGTLFQLTTFGESHGPAIGGIIDGCPAGVELDLEAIQRQLDRRKPGQSALTTQRKESDTVQWLSGIYQGKTLGTPIGFLIPNQDAKSKDYDHLQDRFRPGHADRTYQLKYGFRDHRGGGRASARETACRVVAGALAEQLLTGVDICAWVSAVGEERYREWPDAPSRPLVDAHPVRCPHPATAEKMEAAIRQARKEGDSLGGVISVRVRGLPAGWGEPVFDKLHADLGKAMLSINAVKAFEIGSGFSGAAMRGSAHNDQSNEEGGWLSNHAGGVEGGISTGQDLLFRVAFKPVATLMQAQRGRNVAGETVTIEGKGRHDPCVVPRAVPIVEAMTALVLLDKSLLSGLNQFREP